MYDSDPGFIVFNNDIYRKVASTKIEGGEWKVRVAKGKKAKI